MNNCEVFKNSFFHRASSVGAPVKRDAGRLKCDDCSFEEKKLKRVLYKNESGDDALKMGSVNLSTALIIIRDTGLSYS